MRLNDCIEGGEANCGQFNTATDMTVDKRLFLCYESDILVKLI